MAARKPISWNEIRDRARQFSARWRGTTEERAEAQTFWNELLNVYGVDRKRVAVFEKKATRLSTNRPGRIDLFWPRVLITEHKSAGLSLDEAESQALDYLDSIPNDQHPELIVTSDFANIRIVDLTSDTPAEAFTFPLADLSKEADRLGVLAGYKRRTFTSAAEEAANIKAAKLMGSLYVELESSGCNDHTASVLLARILFLLFADDTGIQEKDLFYEWITERTAEDGSDLGSQLALLFQTLNQPEKARNVHLDEAFARFPYANGGLFKETIQVVPFDKSMRDRLIEACHFDWGTISPAVFGSLFQSVKSKKARAQLGEHYTTESNILKALRPLFLDELHSEFQRGFKSARILTALHEKIGKIRILDPACGCGNFLVVAYRELREIERQVISRIRELKGEGQTFLNIADHLKVRLEHFFGIEIEEWPAQVAETALFLVGHQANLRLSETLGVAPDPLPISDAATITRGNALRIEWSRIVKADDEVYVVGNPPFVGMAKMSEAQQSDNRAVFSTLDKTFRSGRLDYVACWYYKALTFVYGTHARVAFVSTNSLVQGEQARTMGPLLKGLSASIDFAHRTFNWTSEAPDAANVHCVIVGFSMTRQDKQLVRLFDYPELSGEPVESKVPYVNSYLFVSNLPVPTKRTKPFVHDLPPMRQGSKPWDGGGLTVKTQKELLEIKQDSIAAGYIRRYIGSDEMISDLDRWCLWLDGVDTHVMRQSPLLMKRLAHVAETRRKTKTKAVNKQAETPWLFSQRRQPKSSYLAIPEVSSNRREYIPMRMFGPKVIASNKLMTISSPPQWLTGVLLSAWFTLWVKTFAGRLKSDPSISPDMTYNTFPFPDLSESQRERLGTLTDSLFEIREGHLRADPRHPDSIREASKMNGATLDDIYDPLLMPQDVRRAHQLIDKLLDGAFGLKNGTESARLQVMLEMYHKRSQVKS